MLSSSEAQSWWVVFSLLVLCRGTQSRPPTQTWWKFSSRFYTASLSSFPTWRRSSPRSSVGGRQVWKLGGRQMLRVSKESITRGQEMYVITQSQYPYSAQCWVEGNTIQQPKILKVSSQIYWYFSKNVKEVPVQSPQHTSFQIALHTWYSLRPHKMFSISDSWVLSVRSTLSHCDTWKTSPHTSRCLPGAEGLALRVKAAV